MRSIYLFIAICLVAAIIPFYNPDSIALPELSTEPDWPVEYLSPDHKKTALSGKEKQFYKNFPGKMIKLSSGNTEYVIKWVTRPTRKLHPASDCYKGSGYSITPGPVKRDKNGNHWSSFTATKIKSNVLVKERIYNNSGQSWPDVSGWFWSALFNKNSGPWWVVTVSEFSNMPKDSMVIDIQSQEADSKPAQQQNTL